jgi:NADH-quinone oxidoreductase subunit J
VIVYVGGILVLFVFVIMLIALERSMQERHYNKQWLIALIVAGLLIAEFLFVLLQGEQSLALAERPAPAPSRFGLTGNSQLVGEMLYTTYLLPFEIASVLLLVAIVGAVALARRRTQVE